jgi:hypothetical protein
MEFVEEFKNAAVEVMKSLRFQKALNTSSNPL